MSSFLTKPKFLIPAALLLLVVVYLKMIHPLGGQLATLKADRQSTERELTQATKTTKPSGTSSADANRKTLEAAVPPAVNLSEMLRQLDATARAAGVRQSTITPAESAAVAGTIGTSIRVTVSATGSRDAIENYLRQLATLDRMFISDQVSMQETAVSSGAAGAGAASSSASAGDVQLQLSGRVLSTATLSTASSTTTPK
ncbi:MAG: hypothetical protein QOJ19_4620 [Acidimicrobiia bacterium]|jgi:Tfp pilus assembly protein PilO|nr:hypothetical protein [Acidimicrobiia bacterium]